MTFEMLVWGFLAGMAVLLVVCIRATRTCPFCKMFIPRSATRCARCCADLPPRTQAIP
jgi:hypothetical protein